MVSNKESLSPDEFIIRYNDTGLMNINNINNINSNPFIISIGTLIKFSGNISECKLDVVEHVDNTTGYIIPSKVVTYYALEAFDLDNNKQYLIPPRHFMMMENTRYINNLLPNQHTITLITELAIALRGKVVEYIGDYEVVTKKFITTIKKFKVVE